MPKQLQQGVEVVELEPTPAAVGRARDFVAACVVNWGLDRLAPDASLLTSELVSPARRDAAGCGPTRGLER